jgi:hypothetical protein
MSRNVLLTTIYWLSQVGRIQNTNSVGGKTQKGTRPTSQFHSKRDGKILFPFNGGLKTIN